MAAREVQRLLRRMLLTSILQPGVTNGSHQQRWRYIAHVVHRCQRYNSSSSSSSSHAHTSSTGTPILSTVVHGEVTVTYQRGLPVITVPLPSRRERCRFTLRPVSHTVGDFLHEIKNEDKGIDRIGLHTPDGIRIAASSSIESLMQDDFRLILNDVVYHVSPPPLDRLTHEELERLSDVRKLVYSLFEALHVDEHQLGKERALHSKLEELRVELEPLEKKRKELAELATRRTTFLSWFGLGLMATQFGILARLTWWEYSWDIMEPVTYFVTYGTTMAAYAYFVLTKQEYILDDVKDRQFLVLFHKRAKKIGLDVNRYNELKESITQLEKDLGRLRDPLFMHLPPRQTTSGKKTTTSEKSLPSSSSS